MEVGIIDDEVPTVIDWKELPPAKDADIPKGS
jgi:hypothetical protein